MIVRDGREVVTDVQVVPANEWANVADGDTTNDRVLGNLAGAPADRDGECPECLEPIYPGEHIVLTASREWVHEECGQ